MKGVPSELTACCWQGGSSAELALSPTALYGHVDT